MEPHDFFVTISVAVEATDMSDAADRAIAFIAKGGDDDGLEVEVTDDETGDLFTLTVGAGA